MSIRGFHILWFQLQMEKQRHFRFPFPIPMYIFQEILDCVVDLLELVCLFVPNRSVTNTHSNFSVYAIKELVIMTCKLLDSITDYGPYDLVDVTTDQVRISIKVR